MKLSDYPGANKFRTATRTHPQEIPTDALHLRRSSIPLRVYKYKWHLPPIIPDYPAPKKKLLEILKYMGLLGCYK